MGPAPIKLPAVLCHEKKQLCLGMPLLCNEACSKIYLQQPLDEGLLTHQTRQKCFFVCSSLFCPSITSLVKADKPVSPAQMRSGRRSISVTSLNHTRPSPHLLGPVGESPAQLLFTHRSLGALSYPCVHSVLFLSVSKSSHHPKPQLLFCKAGTVMSIS